jgi:hypothetical protein
MTSISTARTCERFATSIQESRVTGSGLTESATTVSPAARLSAATAYATRYPASSVASNSRLARPERRIACSIESIRRCTAPIRRANSRAIVVFPVPGKPPRMMSMFCNMGSVPYPQRRGKLASRFEWHSLSDDFEFQDGRPYRVYRLGWQKDEPTARLWVMNSEKPPHKSVSTAAGLALLIPAIALLFTAVRPSPALSLDRHWQVFGKYAIPAALLLVGASLLVGTRYRIAVCVASVLVLSIAALKHPVCVLIPEAERPAFETVIPLRERAARGEPFCNIGGEWYQCKSFISRELFF